MADNPYEPERPEDDPARQPASPDAAAPEEQTTDPSAEPAPPWRSAEPADPEPSAEPAPPWRSAEPADSEPLPADEPLSDGDRPVPAGGARSGEPGSADPDTERTPSGTDDATTPLATTDRDTSAHSPAPTTQVAGPGAVGSTFDLRDRSAGAHEADRPVPRSGLAEHHSAGYLTGELSPPEPETTTAGAADQHPAAPADAQGETQVVESTARPRTDREDPVLAGATHVGKPPSRARAHVWGVLITLLLTPVAWYLLADAGARLTLPGGNPWDTTNLNIAALLELAGGLLVLVVVLLAARWSSVGAFVTGSLVLVLGVPFVAVPAWTQDLLQPVTDWLATLGNFGDNVAHHLVATGSTGRFVVYGVALILIGVISHGARRQGRREVHTARESDGARTAAD